jgi:hypothetical protein
VVLPVGQLLRVTPVVDVMDVRDSRHSPAQRCEGDGGSREQARWCSHHAPLLETAAPPPWLTATILFAARCTKVAERLQLAGELPRG